MVFAFWRLWFSTIRNEAAVAQQLVLPFGVDTYKPFESPPPSGLFLLDFMECGMTAGAEIQSGAVLRTDFPPWVSQAYGKPRPGSTVHQRLYEPSGEAETGSTVMQSKADKYRHSFSLRRALCGRRSDLGDSSRRGSPFDEFFDGRRRYAHRAPDSYDTNASRTNPAPERLLAYAEHVCRLGHLH